MKRREIGTFKPPPATARQLRAVIRMPPPADLRPGEAPPPPLQITIRVPSLPKASAALKAIGLQGIRTLAASAGAFVAGGDASITLLGMMAVAGPALPSGVGALIGLGWADPVFELETAPPADLTERPLLAYGAAVWEELEDAGWDLSAVMSVALPILRELLDGMQVSAEVRELADFFAPPKAPPISDPLSSTHAGQVSGPGEGSPH